ncbi:MAG: CDC27 family protein [Bacteroidales bacterium]|nr:CDC27 family protein [Bacteroidales bacterium]
MKKIEFNRFLEKYLEGKMQSAEKKWFEAELEGNPGLKKELELRRKINSHLENQDAIAFRQSLMKAEARHRKTAAKRKVATKQLVQYAAVFAGLILIASIGLYTAINKADVNIAEKYSPEYVPLSVTRSSSASIDEAYLRATEYYNAGNYTEAIEWFNRIVATDMQVEFMKGSSHMKISQYEKAIGSFSKVVEDNDNLFIEDARFYLAVCYLHTGEEDTSKILLGAIINSENRHKKEARKLLRKID